MGPIELSFDVTNALPADLVAGQRVLMAAWLFMPDDLRKLGAKPVTLTLLPGGSYDKRYFHPWIPGHEGYSAASHLAQLGNIVLLPDHLGVGESTRLANQKQATRQIVALANHAAVSQFYDRLARGEVHPSLAPIARFTKIGGGHSLGAMQTIVQQATHRSYDGVMILGYTADAVHLTIGGKKLRAADFITNDEPPDYSTSDRAMLHEGFYFEDVPAAVISADDAQAVETPTSIGLDSIRTGIVREDAAKIDAPVYICLGERDVSPDPYLEPTYYRRSTDITLHILPRSGHCQNFAGTRQQMWNRMHAWARSVA